MGGLGKLGVYLGARGLVYFLCRVWVSVSRFCFLSNTKEALKALCGTYLVILKDFSLHSGAKCPHRLISESRQHLALWLA